MYAAARQQRLARWRGRAAFSYVDLARPADLARS
jgi:hypothetical protein